MMQTSASVSRPGNELLESKAVQSLFSMMRKVGSFAPGRILHEIHYQAVLDGMLVLGYLAELRVPPPHSRVRQAVEYCFTLQQDDDNVLKHYSSSYGKILRSFLLLSYAGDVRVDKIATLLLTSQRQDGGYLCDARNRPRHGAPKKSIILGSVGALTRIIHECSAHFVDQ
jgi:hypothetical protein